MREEGGVPNGESASSGSTLFCVPVPTLTARPATHLLHKWLQEGQGGVQPHVLGSRVVRQRRALRGGRGTQQGLHLQRALLQLHALGPRGGLQQRGGVRGQRPPRLHRQLGKRADHPAAHLQGGQGAGGIDTVGKRRRRAAQASPH